jgi:hypothetical protein
MTKGPHTPSDAGCKGFDLHRFPYWARNIANRPGRAKPDRSSEKPSPVDKGGKSLRVRTSGVD